MSESLHLNGAEFRRIDAFMYKYTSSRKGSTGKITQEDVVEAYCLEVEEELAELTYQNLELRIQQTVAAVNHLARIYNIKG